MNRAEDPPIATTPQAPPVGIAQAFAASLRGIISPARAGAVMLRATGPALASVLVFWILVAAYGLLESNWYGLAWDMRLYGYGLPPNATTINDAVESQQTAGQIWVSLHTLTPVRAFIGWPLVAAIGIALLWNGIAIANLSRVQRGGGFRSTYACVLRAQSASAAFVALVAVAVSFYLNTQGWLFSNIGPLDDDIMAMFIMGAAALGSMLHISRAIRLNAASQPPELNPRCEACGYDLTATAADARCPECGRPAAESLDPRLGRPGDKWDEGDRRIDTFFVAWWDVLLHPRQYYSRLRLRGELAAAHAFNRWNKALGMIGGPIWFAAMMTISFWARHNGFGPTLRQAFEIMFVFAVWIPVVLTFGQRLCAAAFAGWWVLAGRLADGRWTEKVILYESAYLWVFLCYWGGLVGSFILYDDWMSQWVDAFGPYRSQTLFGGMPPEIVTLLGGTGLLALIWLWRYEIALRAVRYNNA